MSDLQFEKDEGNTRYPEYLRGLLLSRVALCKLADGAEDAIESFYESCFAFDLDFPTH